MMPLLQTLWDSSLFKKEESKAQFAHSYQKIYESFNSQMDQTNKEAGHHVLGKASPTKTV